jgi:hypothetical protein
MSLKHQRLSILRYQTIAFNYITPGYISTCFIISVQKSVGNAASSAIFSICDVTGSFPLPTDCVSRTVVGVLSVGPLATRSHIILYFLRAGYRRAQSDNSPCHRRDHFTSAALISLAGPSSSRRRSGRIVYTTKFDVGVLVNDDEFCRELTLSGRVGTWTRDSTHCWLQT